MSETLLRIGPDLFPVTEAGQGPPLVLLHGAPGDRRTWRDVVARLGSRFRCFSYTQRWFGDAPWRANGPPFGTHTHAADLRALIEALGIGPVLLVAWSYSGHVAFQAALEAPQLFRKLLVYEPGVPTYVTNPQSLAEIGEDVAGMFGPVAEALQQGAAIEAMRRLIDATGGPGWFDRQPGPTRAIHLASLPVLPLLMGGGDPPAEITVEALQDLAVPARIACGEKTRPLFRRVSQAGAAAVGGPLLEIPDAGHLWPEQDPSGFADLICDWASSPSLLAES